MRIEQRKRRHAAALAEAESLVEAVERREGTHLAPAEARRFDRLLTRVEALQQQIGDVK